MVENSGRPTATRFGHSAAESPRTTDISTTKERTRRAKLAPSPTQSARCTKRGDKHEERNADAAIAEIKRMIGDDATLNITFLRGDPARTRESLSVSHRT